MLNPEDWINSFLRYLLFGGIFVIVAHPTIKKDLGDDYVSIYFLVFIVVVIFWGLLYIFAIIWTILESLLRKKQDDAVINFECENNEINSQEVELKIEIEVV